MIDCLFIQFLLQADATKHLCNQQVSCFILNILATKRGVYVVFVLKVRQSVAFVVVNVVNVVAFLLLLVFTCTSDSFELVN